MNKYIIIIVIYFLYYLIPSYAFYNSAEFGTVEGNVFIKKTKMGLEYVNIVVMNTELGAVSENNGYFIIPKVPAGNYYLRFSFVGYETYTTLIKIETGKTINLQVNLREKPIEFIDPIVVTPGRYTVEKTESAASQILSRKQIEEMPHLGEDIYRAVQMLPGLASNDFTSQLYIRGGEEDEVLVRIDGMELYKPFHIRDFEGGAVSALNSKLIKKAELLTGGYPSEFGDKMSGVFNLTTIDGKDLKGNISTAIGLATAEFLFGGNIGEKGSYLLSLRRGYLDIVLGLINMEEELSPDYYDIYGKYKYWLNDNNAISFNYLRIGDHFRWNRDDPADNFDTKYSNDYFWTSWQYIPSQKFFNRALFSYVRGNHKRYLGFDPTRDRAIDFQNFDVFGFTNDATFAISDKNILKIGVNLKNYSTNYDYFETEDWDGPGGIYPPDTTHIIIAPGGFKFSSYIQDKFFLTEKTSMNIGFRYDYQKYIKKSQFSPRLGLAYNLAKNMVLRAAWGYYYQSQEMADLEVAKGITEFEEPENSQHYVLGWEYQPTELFNIRIESYYKYYGKLIDKINDRKNRKYLYPDKGYSRGIEFLVRRQQSRKINWWCGYSLSVTKEKILDRYIFRDFDQTHSAIFSFSYTPIPNWNVNAIWKYHTGFRYTSKVYEPAPMGRWRAIYSDINELKFPPFHKLDVKISHSRIVMNKNLSFFIEVYNLYNRNNIREYRWPWREVENNVWNPFPKTEYWLPIIPSFGIRIDF